MSSIYFNSTIGKIIMTKKLTLIFSALTLWLMMGTANAGLIEIDTDPTTADSQEYLDVTVGDTFTVDIVIDTLEDFAGFGFDLAFNDSVLSLEDITSANVFGFDTEVLFNGSDIGIASLSEAISFLSFATEGLLIDSKTVLASINFNVIGEGTSVLSLENLSFSDFIGGDIALDTINNATVSATNAVQVPEPSTWVLLMFALLTIGLTQQKRFSK